MKLIAALRRQHRQRQQLTTPSVSVAHLLTAPFSLCLQIVIAGASQTALSCLEQLLLQRHTSFNSLTLLAPGGVPVGGVACTYTAGLVARMGLQAAVTIVDGQMASLDTAQKLVGLDDGSQLPYDLLVVATGLQVCEKQCCSSTSSIT
jgi:hypothetical protein